VADEVRLELGDDGVAEVSLHRPDQLNIFNLAMRDALIEAVTAVRDSPGVGALVLRADGPHFSAGADLAEFGTAESAFEARRIRWDRDPWGPLWDLPCPTVAALHGIAVGSGLEMTLLCDVRLAAPDTRVGLPEVKLGMLPAAGGTQTLTRAIGPHAALPLVATARTVPAAEALALGIIHRVVEDVEGEARATARRLAALEPGVASAARRALHAAGDLALDQGLAYEKHLASALAGIAGAGGAAGTADPAGTAGGAGAARSPTGRQRSPLPPGGLRPAPAGGGTAKGRSR
jgi:enoyl-CoA hydratase/carnithine racemase